MCKLGLIIFFVVKRAENEYLKRFINCSKNKNSFYIRQLILNLQKF
jgi:hypothetical protein